MTTFVCNNNSSSNVLISSTIFMEFSRTPPISLTSMHQYLAHIQGGVLLMQYKKKQLDWGFPWHQPTICLVGVVDLLCFYRSLDSLRSLDRIWRQFFIFFNLHHLLQSQFINQHFVFFDSCHGVLKNPPKVINLRQPIFGTSPRRGSFDAKPKTTIVFWFPLELTYCSSCCCH
jgi:hypothetical protein